MTTDRLLRKASQTLSTFAATGAAALLLLATPAATAQTQFAVTDSQLQTDVLTTLHNDAALKGNGITATASQGVVTLSGSVPDEASREEAENAAAGVSGVRSIQDNLSVAGAPAPSAQAQNTSTMPPPPPDADDQPAPQQQPPQAQTSQGTGMPPPPPPEQAGTQQQYTPFPNASAPNQAPNQQQAPGMSQNAQNQPYANQPYPNQPYPAENGGYGPRGNAHPPQSFGVSPQQQNASGPVTVPAGTLLSVRTTQPLSTGELKGGELFQVTAAADVYANGVLAIPRGAVLSGQVVEAKNAGPFGGSPTLDLKLTSIQLGPATYPLVSEVWTSKGPSKTGYTATNAAGGAIFGALIGAIAGGGVGAGVGAIAGGTGGALISAATHGPRLDLPPEALLQFRIAQPLTVQPVKYGEAQRLANSLPQPPVLRQRPQYVAAPYPPPYPYYARPYPY